MIFTKTCYKTHNGELSAIVEAFKTWRHDLEGCKHKVLVLTNHNNLHRFIDIKSSSSHQVRWTQKLFQYHFRINYCQKIVNGAADVLSHFPQKNQAKEDKLQTKNTRILHKLQSSLTNANLWGLSISAELLPLYQILICGTHVLPQIWQFWNMLQAKFGDKSPYQVSISVMHLKFWEL